MATTERLCYTWPSLVKAAGAGALPAAALGLAIGGPLPFPAKPLALALSLAAAAATILRHHIDNGGAVPVPGTSFYVRRWALPSEAKAALLQPALLRACETLRGGDEPAPLHPALRDPRALARGTIVAIAFDRSKGAPVLLQLSFRARCYSPLVCHAGPAIVEARLERQAPDLCRALRRRLAALGMAMNCLTFFAAGFVFTGLGPPPGAEAQASPEAELFSDLTTSFFPNRRFCHAQACGGGALPWQADIAAFLMANHRYGQKIRDTKPKSERAPHASLLSPHLCLWLTASLFRRSSKFFFI